MFWFRSVLHFLLVQKLMCDISHDRIILSCYLISAYFCCGNYQSLLNSVQGCIKYVLLNLSFLVGFLSSANTFSTGLNFGEYGGRKNRVRFSEFAKSLTSCEVWILELSRMTTVFSLPIILLESFTRNYFAILSRNFLKSAFFPFDCLIVKNVSLAQKTLSFCVADLNFTTWFSPIGNHVLAWKFLVLNVDSST